MCGLDHANSASPTAKEAGGIRIGTSGDAGATNLAQEAANSGQVVLASCAQRPTHDVDTGDFEPRPGHIAIVRPLIALPVATRNRTRMADNRFLRAHFSSRA
jgi:hypothetical protein